MPPGPGFSLPPGLQLPPDVADLLNMLQNKTMNPEDPLMQNVQQILTNIMVSYFCHISIRNQNFMQQKNGHHQDLVKYEYKRKPYKGRVHSVLEYGSSVWDSQNILLQDELEKVQKRAAGFVTGNYTYETESMTGILDQLKWESLKKRRKDGGLITLNKGLKGAANMSTNHLVSPKRCTRNHHPLRFQTPLAGTDILKKAIFFPKTIRDWNSLDRFPYLCF